MDSLYNFYEIAKSKRKQVLKDIFQNNLDSTLNFIENQLKNFKGNSDVLNINISKVSGFDQNVGTAVEVHLKKQNIKCKYLYDEDSDSHTLYVYFH